MKQRICSALYFSWWLCLMYRWEHVGDDWSAMCYPHHYSCFCRNAKGHRGPSEQVACCISCQGTIFLPVSLSNASRSMEVAVLFASTGIAICSQENRSTPPTPLPLQWNWWVLFRILCQAALSWLLVEGSLITNISWSSRCQSKQEWQYHITLE